ncbi:hypothetical protein ZIOFF_038665 [Zingiber officinale]|uniref:N-acetyl-D-glucosamine kinase n=1 Tax=Zingiber officinale TaxID=94328 RepID=A0A8J5G998_ZINOF|nr:hypothetical protein ZIOFF_038665 [Zingiber officinale]
MRGLRDLQIPGGRGGWRRTEAMKRYRNGEIWGFESQVPPSPDGGVVLGVDGGTTSTVCVCLPASCPLPEPLPVLSRAVGGCSNHNSVGENAARECLEEVMAQALSEACCSRSSVRAVCLAVSGVNHPSDQQRIINWLRQALSFIHDYDLVDWLFILLINSFVGKLGDNEYVGILWRDKTIFLVSFNRNIFPDKVTFYVENDAVAAMASGTMGKLYGCVLIAGTGTIAYGFTEDGKQARAAGAGPVLGDWGRLYTEKIQIYYTTAISYSSMEVTDILSICSGYGIAAQALTAVIRAHDGRGPQTKLTKNILDMLELSSPDELIGWTYADSSWARIAALVPTVVSTAEDGDEVANKILYDSVQELADSIIAVVKRLRLCGEDGKDIFPLVMVGGVLEANKRWDIGKEVVKCISKVFPGALPIQPKVEPAVGAALVAWSRYTKKIKDVQDPDSPQISVAQ